MSRAGCSGRPGAVPVGSISYRASERSSGLTAAELLLNDQSARSPTHYGESTASRFRSCPDCTNFSASMQILLPIPVIRLQAQA
jgi:hypothetical protein